MSIRPVFVIVAAAVFLLTACAEAQLSNAFGEKVRMASAAEDSIGNP